MTNPISLTASTAPLALTLQSHGHAHGHGHRKNASLETGTAVGSTGSAATAGSKIGQLPVGVSSSLFGNLLQSLGQSIGAQANAASSTPAVGAVDSASVAGASASATLNAHGKHVNASV